MTHTNSLSGPNATSLPSQLPGKLDVGCLESLVRVGDSVVTLNAIVSFAVGGLVTNIVGDKVGGGKVGLVVITKGCVVGDPLGLEDGAGKGFGTSIGDKVGG